MADAIFLCHSSIIAVFNEAFNVKKPIMPATNELNKIINLALLIIVALSNASSVMKMDMVNPIPPKIPTLKMFFQFRSAGSLQSLIFVAIKVRRQMPKGFPIINPTAMPIL